MAKITIHQHRIPANRLRQFHDILCSTGGRYLRGPLRVGNIVIVDYEPGDYEAFTEAWSRVTIPVRELRRDQWWRRWFRRIRLWFR